MASPALQGGHLSQNAVTTDLAHASKQSSVAPPPAPHASLKAPNRTRSISVDDFLDGANPPGCSTVNATPRLRPQADNSSSDSDDDENENHAVSKHRSAPHTDRVGAPLRKGQRTPSAMSLESLQNESECSDGANGRKRPLADISQSRVDAPAALPNVAHTNGSAASKRLKSDQWPVPARSASYILPASHIPAVVTPSKMGNQSGVAVRQQGIPSESVTVPGKHPTPKTTGQQDALSNSFVVPGKHPAPKTGQLQPVSAEQPIEPAMQLQTQEKGLVNIAAIPEADGTSWDRFIFFAHRVQRFYFEQSAFLSAFSPFAQVASDMEEVTPASVCAVCGAGGVLATCSRCPLAFHSGCIDPLKKRMNRSPWFCDACFAVKGNDTTDSWYPPSPPPLLPPPSSGFDRLIVDAEQGNPIDLIFNPTLFKYYKSQCGNDWLRCCKCQQIVITGEGVLAESVHIPFECSYAFWLPEETRKCAPRPQPGEQRNVPEEVATVEDYVRQRSRRRNALFYHSFGEEDRADYGYPSLGDVIVIDDDPLPDGEIAHKHGLEHDRNVNGAQTARNHVPRNENQSAHQSVNKEGRKLAPMVQVVRPTQLANAQVTRERASATREENKLDRGSRGANIAASTPNLPVLPDRSSTERKDVHQVSRQQANPVRTNRADGNNQGAKTFAPQVAPRQKGQKLVVSDASLQNVRNLAHVPGTNPGEYPIMGRAVHGFQTHPDSLKSAPKPQTIVPDPTPPSNSRRLDAVSAFKPAQTPALDLSAHGAASSSAVNISGVPRRGRVQTPGQNQDRTVRNQNGKSIQPDHSTLTTSDLYAKELSRRQNVTGRVSHASTTTPPVSTARSSIYPLTNVVPAPQSSRANCTAAPSLPLGSNVPNVQADPYNTRMKVQVINPVVPPEASGKNMQHASGGKGSSLHDKNQTTPSVIPEHTHMRRAHGKEEQIPESLEVERKTKRKEDSKNVKVESEELQPDILQHIASLEMDMDTEDILTDLALANDKALIQLYTAFRSDEARFRRHATRLALKRQQGSSSKVEVLGDATNAGTGHNSLSAGSNGAPDAVTDRMAVSKTSYGNSAEEPSANFNAHMRKVRLKHLREMQELDAQLIQQMANAPLGAIPQLQLQQHQIRQKLTMRQEEETKQVMKMVSSKYAAT